MVVRVGLLVGTRLVVNFHVAWCGRVALACRGIVPATVATIVAIVRVVSTFFHVVTRLVRRARVFWITPALVERMLGLRSMQVTGLKVLVASDRRCLAFNARIPSGTMIIVPRTIIRARRNSSGIVAISAFVVRVLSFVPTMGVTTHLVVIPLFELTAHLASGGLSDLILSLLLK